MWTLSARNIFAVCIFNFAVLFFGPGLSFAEFSVNWGTSFDNGLIGHQQVAQWLVGNNYYNNINDADSFARTGYIGHDNGDPDPFFWSLTGPFTFQVVQEISAYADLNTFGYYIGNGNIKSLTEIFSGTENGPKTLSIDQPFGLYMGTPEQNFWYTERGENDLQKGILKKSGGNPQALIYELTPDQEWLVAWEDLDATRFRSDRDYNDMFVKVTAGPEPVSSALFLLGGGAITAALRMRRKE